ncbi:MAG TPA: UDP-N-acetylmuramate--L-alanine ligase [Bacteroidales bacterium]|nr:UDP-N-acetylmuramate--L-alanine ligase [Bacteroidales bacterium]
MTEFDNIEGIYFLGIGGIGMSALARYFLAGRFSVCGYDRSRTPLTIALEEEGCNITYEDDLATLPALFDEPVQRDKVMVIYTPAVPKDSVLLNFFTDRGYSIYKRSEILGFISRGTDTIAVAGTHGKTTVSTMTAHLLTASQVGCSAFLGGISRNYNTNLLLGKSQFTVMEADEFDRSFLTLSPRIAIVTAIDPDHLDIYGTPEAMVGAYSEFCHKVHRGGTLITEENITASLSLPADVTLYTYGFGEKASFRAENIEKGDGFYTFDIITPGEKISNIRLLLPGQVNILNATAAAAVAILSGVTPAEIRNGLFLYQGVQRRFDVRYASEDLIYMDDYAHHPGEINALVSAVRDFYPGRPITGIFQPHLYTRTRDFAEEFAEALDRLDEVLLLTLYPAREKPIEGVSSDMIAAMMKNRNVRVVTRDELLPAADKTLKGILLTIGAGDIDRFVEPIIQMLKKRKG